MSVYLYLECCDHDPPLSSDDVGQHLTDLPRIRNEIANRKVFVAAAEHFPDYEYFTRNAARFFIRHPHCAIGIRDEYGALLAADKAEEDA